MEETNHFTELMAEIERVRCLLQDMLDRRNGSPSKPPPSLPSSMCPALDRLCRQLNLSAFERNVLVLCAGWEIVPDFLKLIADFNKSPGLSYPTWTLALHLFGNTNPQAVIPPAPLYTWKLVKIQKFGQSFLPLLHSPLQLDSSILSYLIGKPYQDESISDRMRPLAIEVSSLSLAAADLQIVSDLDRWRKAPKPASSVQLYGDDLSRQRRIVAAFCHQANAPLYHLPLEAIPEKIEERQDLLRRWHRHAQLTYSILLLEIGETEGQSAQKLRNINHWLQCIETPTFISSPKRLPEIAPSALQIEVPKLTFTERRTVWLSSLGDRARAVGAGIDILADLFPLAPQKIATICHHVSAVESSANLSDRLWEACRTYARTQLDALAQRVQTKLNLEDLVLPEECIVAIEELIAMARYRIPVYHCWGFAETNNRGLGLCALFTGQSGTGKTTAAEIVAKELNLDCYRIDLSQMVSKYIGETEKNLKQIFDAAEAGSAVLLFDEADALFGKRGTVREARDRYANQQVSYLLQRLEIYPGLAILTTNLTDAIDDAFQRRLKFIVNFPFPDVEQRAEIWRRVFPPQAPTQGLDYQRLAQLNVSGGSIKNIALDAAFRAIKAEKAIQMKHLLEAAQAEAKRTKRTMIARETFGWVEPEKK